MNGERRGWDRDRLGRAIACALGLTRDRVATATVLLAIVVSLAGACVVIAEASVDRPAHPHLTLATAE